MERVLSDYQPVLLAVSEDSKKVRSETRSVKATNVISERDFAQLDRLLREKPSASTLALEAHILFSNNKTSKWLTAKSPSERSIFLEEARKNAPKHRQKYREHLEAITHVRNEQQKQRQKEREYLERKAIEIKEKITSEITDYGLWVTSAQVDSALHAMRSETHKRTALKAQLRFRKTVLQQQSMDESVYKFSRNNKYFKKTYSS